MGFAGPFDICSPEEMWLIRDRILLETFRHDSPTSGHQWNARHMDSRLVYDLCTAPPIISRLQALCGEDIILWNSSFWIKGAQSPATPWHQDLHYWSLPVTLTAWIAINDSGVGHGCLRVIPGSHRHILPTRKADKPELFEKIVRPPLDDRKAAIDLELKAGQFVLFGDRLVHCSKRNETQGPARVGLAARYTVPWVKLPAEELPFFPQHRAFLVSGKDSFGLNRMGRKPEY